ncbi:MAG: ribonuclease Y [Planctomycetes bacterium]|nr:ribonuclease Y [Planctomycetota bacterium]
MLAAQVTALLAEAGGGGGRSVGTLVLAGVLLLLAGYGLRWAHVRLSRRIAEKRGRDILEAARRDAEVIVRESEIQAKDASIREREKVEAEISGLRKELRQQERRLLKREEALDRRAESQAARDKRLEEAERRLIHKQDSLRRREEDLGRLLEAEKEALHSVSGLSRKEAEAILIARLDRELAGEASALVQKRVDETHAQAEERAREILALALQRVAAEHTAETVIATVDIPSDDMKGRIIGREGRNIRAFEKATGTDVIVDDTPGVVVVSGFDPVRREIASRALERLIMDGRIHPSRIEEVVAQTRKDFEEQIREHGKRAVVELDLHNLPPRIVHLLGRLHFHRTRGRNTLAHAIEVGQIAGLLAAELNLDPVLARRAGLLHDIGKAVNFEAEGAHDAAGADFARRSDERREVVNAIAAHHGAVKPESLYAVVVEAANKISHSRPQDSRDVIEKFIRRLERLEAIAMEFEGVERAYAIQAGREVKVIVDNVKVDDAVAMKLVRDIARAIEQRSSYPGEIRVILIRETRVVEYAK